MNLSINSDISFPTFKAQLKVLSCCLLVVEVGPYLLEYNFSMLKSKERSKVLGGEFWILTIGKAISRLIHGILGSGVFKVTALDDTRVVHIAIIRSTHVEISPFLFSPIIVRLGEAKECGPDRREEKYDEDWPLQTDRERAKEEKCGEGVSWVPSRLI